MHERQTIPIAKHLEDVDDLTYRRDSGLVEGQEVRAEAMADAIYEHALKNNFKIVLFCVSTKKRARETAELVSEFLRSKPNSPKVLVERDSNLREIDQGTFVLPKDYKAGDEYEGLKIAGKVFSRETFNPTDPDKDNLDYHFGDPLKQKDGTYKYPELVKYFSAYGESYREILLRFYAQVLKLAGNAERFSDRVGVVVFTHGQSHQIFSNLAEVADKIVEEKFAFAPSTLPRICWDLYNSRPRRVIPFGELAFVSIDHISNPQVIALLEREAALLQKKGGVMSPFMGLPPIEAGFRAETQVFC